MLTANVWYERLSSATKLVYVVDLDELLTKVKKECATKGIQDWSSHQELHRLTTMENFTRYACSKWIPSKTPILFVLNKLDKFIRQIFEDNPGTSESIIMT